MTFEEKINEMLVNDKLQDAFNIILLVAKVKDENIYKNLMSCNAELVKIEYDFIYGNLEMKNYKVEREKISNQLKIPLFDSNILKTDYKVICEEYENKIPEKNKVRATLKINKCVVKFCIIKKREIKYFLLVLFAMASIVAILYFSFNPHKNEIENYNNKIEILNKRVTSLSDSILFYKKENFLIKEKLEQENNISKKAMDSLKTILEEQKQKLYQYSKRLTVAENKLRELSKSVENIKDLSQVENGLKETEELIVKFREQNDNMKANHSLHLTRDVVNSIDLETIKQIEQLRDEFNAQQKLLEAQQPKNISSCEQNSHLIDCLNRSEIDYIEKGISYREMNDDLSFYRNKKDSLNKIYFYEKH